jgi:hypothetical protein
MPIFPTSSATAIPEEISSAQNGGSAFVQVSIELMMREDISPAALKLYMFLLYYSGPKNSAWPSQSRLAERMHLTERRIRTLLGELVEAGLIFVSHNTGTSNTYHLRKFQLKSSGRNSHASTEQNNQGERKDSSDHVHDLESINMCESPSQDFAQAKNSKTPENPVTQDSEQIQKLFESVGMSTILSQELTLQVLSFKRDISYVKQIIESSRSSKISNPVGFIRFMVLRNAVPITKQSILQKMPRKAPENKPPLDFEKYTSGKYAFLLGEKQESGTETKSDLEKLDLITTPQVCCEVDNVITQSWLKTKTLLRMTGNVSEKSLQHIKLRVATNNTIQIYYPSWLSLSQSQQNWISEALTSVLGDNYTVTI